MRACTVASLVLITAALSGCASAVEPAPTPTPTATPIAEIISNCWLNHADIGVPDGSEEIWEAAYAADVGDGAFVGERPWMESMPSDGIKIEAFVGVCREQPMSRDELIEAATAIAVFIEAHGAGAPLERLNVRALHLGDRGELVDGPRVVTSFQLHAWSPDAAIDPARWE